MNTTVESLKDYYVAQGGTLADVADLVTIPDMIDAITALGGSGKSGGAGGVTVVNVTKSGNTYTLSMTAAELYDACLNGYVVSHESRLGSIETHYISAFAYDEVDGYTFELGYTYEAPTGTDYPMFKNSDVS